MADNKRKTILHIVVGFLAGVAVTFGAVLAVMSGVGSGPVIISGDSYDYYKQLDERYSKLDSVYEEIMVSYYIDPDEEMMQEMMYKGLVAGLEDPYSAYMTAEEYESYQASLTGEFEGIGITFTTDNEGDFVIISVSKNSPAEKAGLKAGDILLKADGKTYETMEAISQAIRGKAGTVVKITYSREGKEHEVDIKREKIVNETVTGEVLDGNIGYISISAFEMHTSENFIDMLEDMEAKKVKGLIIDLRDNGGGIVNSCVEITDTLMGKGTIVSMEDRYGNSEEFDSDKETTALPYVVLINENSASAAEIMAAAIKDNTDNPLVGTTTFGKGIVQYTGKLDDGSALKLTIMQYFSPKGTVIHEKGVKPDYEVKNNGEVDTQLIKAMELLK